MVLKNERMIRKIFERIYGIACHGEHFNDGNNWDIPYEFDKDGKISDLSHKIYELRKRISEDLSGKYYDLDDYDNLINLVTCYERLMKEFCYKMFYYGFKMNLKNSKGPYVN